MKIKVRWSTFALLVLALVAVAGVDSCISTKAAPPSTIASPVGTAPAATATPTPTPNTTQASAQTNYDMTVDLITSWTWEAQTFTAPFDGYIERVSVNIKKVGSPPNPLTVSIRAMDADGSPTGADLANGTISASTVSGTSGFVDATLDPKCPLNSNTKYALVMYSTGESSTDYYSWWIQRSDVFAGGNLEQSVNSGSTWTAQPWDASFKLYLAQGK